MVAVAVASGVLDARCSQSKSVSSRIVVVAVVALLVSHEHMACYSRSRFLSMLAGLYPM